MGIFLLDAKTAGITFKVKFGAYPLFICNDLSNSREKILSSIKLVCDKTFVTINSSSNISSGRGFDSVAMSSRFVILIIPC